MRTKPCLEQADVQTIVAACRAEASRQGWKITMAVVDDGGHPLYLERMDGVKVTTVDVAMGKARTAALSWLPSSKLENRIKDRPSILKLASLPMQGGMPILHDGQCVGGVGVAGADFHEDEQVAEAGAAALG